MARAALSEGFTSGARHVLNTLKQTNLSAIFRPDEVRSILLELSRENRFVALNPKGCDDAFTSTLFHEPDAREGLWLRALSPPKEDFYFGVGDSAKLKVAAHDRAYGFSSTVVEVGTRNRQMVYRLSLPRLLTQSPLREHFRVQVPPGIKVYAVDAAANVIRAKLKDISLGGIAATIVSPPSLSVQRGDLLSGLMVRLSTSKIIQGKLQVRHVTRIEDTDLLVLGGQFLGLSKRHWSLLTGFLADCQSAA